jgi:mannose-1-phosphate guanylyltransferase
LILKILISLFACRGEIEDNGEGWESIALEKDIIMPSIGNNGSIYVFHSNRMWSQGEIKYLKLKYKIKIYFSVKTAASAIFSNRLHLALYRERKPERLAGTSAKAPCKIIGNVFIHPTAQIDSSCVVGF